MLEIIEEVEFDKDSADNANKLDNTVTKAEQVERKAAVMCAGELIMQYAPDGNWKQFDFEKLKRCIQVHGPHIKTCGCEETILTDGEAYERALRFAEQHNFTILDDDMGTNDNDMREDVCGTDELDGIDIYNNTGCKDNNNCATSNIYTFKQDFDLEKSVADSKKPRPIPVLCIETSETFPSIAAATRRYDIQDRSILTAALKNNFLTAAGYHWRYV